MSNRAMTHAVFLDTMGYLHYKPVEQIDWHSVLNVPAREPVEIVVAGVTLREIDKHKNHTPRLRGRAQRVGAQLTAWLAGPPADVRPGVRVVAALRPPAVDYEQEGLDRSVNDDVLVAAALDFQRSHPDVTVVVVTQDAYPQLLARSKGLTAVALPDACKLPPADEDAAERENRELRRQLQQMQAARPVLTLEFAAGPDGQEDAQGGRGTGASKQTLEVVLPLVADLTDEAAAARVAAEAAEHPDADAYRPGRGPAGPPALPAGMGDSLPALMRHLERARAAEAALTDSIFGRFDPAEIDRYAVERDEYLRRYADYVRARHAFDRASARRFVLELVLVNAGSVPATDVDIALDLPHEVWVMDADDREEPQRPPPPRAPRRVRDSALGRVFGDLQLAQPPNIGALLAAHSAARREPPNVSAFRLPDPDVAGPNTVRGHVRRIKHGVPETLPPLFVTLPEDAEVRPFQIGYTLHAANLPAAVTGTLNVRLTH